LIVLQSGKAKTVEDRMDQDERIMRDCKMTWREEARGRASKEANEAGLTDVEERERFILERAEIYYTELEKVGLENL
jgi:hypothetical protein